jgi:hypothetical protein
LQFEFERRGTGQFYPLVGFLRNLEAMAADMFVVRHGDSGAAHFIAEHVCPNVAIINGGDGRHAHPTQGMLDMLTIRRHKGSFENLSVAIVGDILHFLYRAATDFEERVGGVEDFGEQFAGQTVEGQEMLQLTLSIELQRALGI